MMDIPKIKIAFVIDTIESPTGGTEKQLLLLIKNLNRDKFEPRLCCLRSSKWLNDAFNACPLHIIGINSFKTVSSYLRIWAFSRFLRFHKFDIIHTYFKDANLVGIIAARLAGIKKVISTRRGQHYWDNIVELVLLKFVNRFVTMFLANSYSTKKWVSKFEGIPEERIQVIYNGIEMDSFKVNSEETRKRWRELLGISDGAYVIGIIANLRPVKGIDVFLRAAQLVKSELPQARFIIVGEGPEKNKLIQLSAKLGLSDSVSFLGTRKDVIRILKALDVGVLSSYSESFSNSIIEYLAAGLPVVCTDVGGCREIIEDRANGFIVPVADHKAMANQIVKISRGGLPKLIESYNHPKIRDKFLLAKIIGDYEKVYCDLVGGLR